MLGSAIGLLTHIDGRADLIVVGVLMIVTSAVVFIASWILRNRELDRAVRRYREVDETAAGDQNWGSMHPPDH